MSDVPVVSLKVLAHGEGLPLPRRESAGAAGYDLRTADDLTLAPGERRIVRTGLAVAIPSGWEGQVRPRSGLAVRHGLTVINSPGTVDADYRGELLIPMVNLGNEPVTIERGDRVAQIVFAAVATVELSVVEELPGGTGRGAGGLGSTGRS